MGPRLAAAGASMASLAVLIVAAWLRPSPDGHGTHTELGLPQCDWVTAFNRPCPTCGMTTAFARAAHLDPVGALLAQPFGALLALATAVVFWASLHVAVTGSRTERVFAPIASPRGLWATAGVAALAWAYKLITW